MRFADVFISVVAAEVLHLTDAVALKMMGPGMSLRTLFSTSFEEHCEDAHAESLASAGASLDVFDRSVWGPQSSGVAVPSAEPGAAPDPSSSSSSKNPAFPLLNPLPAGTAAGGRGGSLPSQPPTTSQSSLSGKVGGLPNIGGSNGPVLPPMLGRPKPSPKAKPGLALAPKTKSPPPLGSGAAAAPSPPAAPAQPAAFPATLWAASKDFLHVAMLRGKIVAWSELQERVFQPREAWPLRCIRILDVEEGESEFLEFGRHYREAFSEGSADLLAEELGDFGAKWALVLVRVGLGFDDWSLGLARRLCPEFFWAVGTVSAARVHTLKEEQSHGRHIRGILSEEGIENCDSYQCWREFGYGFGKPAAVPRECRHLGAYTLFLKLELQRVRDKYASEYGHNPSLTYMEEKFPGVVRKFSTISEEERAALAQKRVPSKRLERKQANRRVSMFTLPAQPAAARPQQQLQGKQFLVLGKELSFCADARPPSPTRVRQAATQIKVPRAEPQYKRPFCPLKILPKKMTPVKKPTDVLAKTVVLTVAALSEPEEVLLVRVGAGPYKDVVFVVGGLSHNPYRYTGQTLEGGVVKAGAAGVSGEVFRVPWFTSVIGDGISSKRIVGQPLKSCLGKMSPKGEIVPTGGGWGDVSETSDVLGDPGQDVTGRDDLGPAQKAQKGNDGKSVPAVAGPSATSGAAAEFFGGLREFAKSLGLGEEIISDRSRTSGGRRKKKNPAAAVEPAGGVGDGPGQGSTAQGQEADAANDDAAAEDGDGSSGAPKSISGEKTGMGGASAGPSSGVVPPPDVSGAPRRVVRSEEERGERLERLRKVAEGRARDPLNDHLPPGGGSVVPRTLLDSFGSRIVGKKTEVSTDAKIGMQLLRIAKDKNGKDKPASKMPSRSKELYGRFAPSLCWLCVWQWYFISKSAVRTEEVLKNGGNVLVDGVQKTARWVSIETEWDAFIIGAQGVFDAAADAALETWDNVFHDLADEDDESKQTKQERQERIQKDKDKLRSSLPQGVSVPEGTAAALLQLGGFGVESEDLGDPDVVSGGELLSGGGAGSSSGSVGKLGRELLEDDDFGGSFDMES